METIVKSTEVEVPKSYILRHAQREELKQDIADIDQMLDSRNPHRLKGSTDTVEAVRRMQRLKKQLATQSPQELPGAAKDKLYKESKALEERIKAGMPTQEEMRKNPSGMVGRHIAWEKKNKADILKWKNIQQLLDPTSEDPDLSNFERIRPSGVLDRLRTDAQITGAMNFRSVPQENWDQVFEAPVNTALEQVKRVEAEIKQRKPFTEEQKQAARERLALARLRKEEKRKAESGDSDGHHPIEGAEPEHQEA